MSESRYKGLLAKFGGELAVEQYIDNVYNMMAADPGLKSFFGQSAGRAFNLQVLKDRTTDYLTTNAPGGWGDGPYHGPEMFSSHMNLNITMKQYDVFMACAKKGLKQKGASSEVTKLVIASFEELREPTCDPSGQLKAEFKSKLAAAEKAQDADCDYDPTGFGMTTSRETAKRWKEAEERRVALKAKMDALKQQRIEQSKKAKELAQQKAQDKARAAVNAQAKRSASPKPKAKGKTKALPKKNEKIEDSKTSSAEVTQDCHPAYAEQVIPMLSFAFEEADSAPPSQPPISFKVDMPGTP